MTIDFSSINPTAVILAIGAFAIVVGAIASSGSGSSGGGNNNGYRPPNNNNFNNNQSASRPSGPQKPFGNLFANRNNNGNFNAQQSNGIFGAPPNNQQNRNQINNDMTGSSFQNQGGNFNQGSNQNNNPNPNNNGNNNGMF